MLFLLFIIYNVIFIFLALVMAAVYNIVYGQFVNEINRDGDLIYSIRQMARC